ncbi:homoserine kinase [Reichenbachiella faecimaris]|uniref:Homoserine kinase n=1 Tax=Reichenbachiella faecimaris TaxID=692418 RepID=A0A1W2GK89_REIFA|nr:homoserine kinase [Reichenbachiella faecimaris]SMD37093.1 homoserine kinase [Reichenbachiella faecimaris]
MIKEQLLEKYNLGETKSVESLTQGYANENLKVITGQGAVLYRICKQQPLHLLEYEVGLMEVMKKANIKTAFPIADKQGVYIQKSDEDFVMLYEFKTGKEPELNAGVAHQMGMEVGKLSQIQWSESLEKKNAVHIDNCHQLVAAFVQSKNQMLEVFGYFCEQTEYLTKKLDSSLPKGIVHGDIFPNNTIFEGENLTAIIDFEEACSDQLMFDVGMTINGFCFRKNFLIPELLQAFLAGYNTQRKMTEAEWLALPIYMQWGSHGMLSWHLRNELINVPNQTQYERVLELMQRTQWMRSNEKEIMDMVC